RSSYRRCSRHWCSPGRCSCPRTTSSCWAAGFTATCGSPSAGAHFRRSRATSQVPCTCLPGLLIAAGCLALSVAQRRLSMPARELRRRTRSVRGVRTRTDGATEELSLAGLLAPLDGALAALSLGVVVLACALVAARL